VRFCRSESGALRRIRWSELPWRYLALGWSNFAVDTSHTDASASRSYGSDVVPGSKWPCRLFWRIRSAVLPTDDVAVERVRLDAIVSTNGTVCTQFSSGCHQSCHGSGSDVRRSRGRESDQYLDVRWNDMDSAVAALSTSMGVWSRRRLPSFTELGCCVRRREWWRRSGQHMEVVWIYCRLETILQRSATDRARRPRNDL